MMTFSEQDYAWRFTGYPWLDGTIFGAGVPRSKNAILIQVSELPFNIAEKIKNGYNEIGYQADYVEMPNAIKKETDLRLHVCGPSPIFNILPRFKERRLDLDNTPLEFIKGYFTVSCHVKLKKYMMVRFKDFKEGIYIHTFLPNEDTLQLLSVLGVEEYEIMNKKVFVPKEVFGDIEPFAEVFKECKIEDDGFTSYLPSRDDELGERMDIMIDEMERGGKLGIDQCEIETFKAWCVNCNRTTAHKKELKDEGKIWCAVCVNDNRKKTKPLKEQSRLDV